MDMISFGFASMKSWDFPLDDYPLEYFPFSGLNDYEEPTVMDSCDHFEDSPMDLMIVSNMDHSQVHIREGPWSMIKIKTLYQIDECNSSKAKNNISQVH
jgi:hypothetical protein